MQIEDFLIKHDFFKYKENLIKFYQFGRDLVTSYNINRTSSFSPSPSLLPLNSPETNDHSPVLVLDIGGTSTKAAIRLSDNADGQWVRLFEQNNSELQPSIIRSNSFELYCELISTLLEQAFSDRKLPKNIRVGVVWSNGLKNYKLKKESLVGIGATVFRRAYYAKKEWFIKDLHEGDSLTDALISALSKKGFIIRRLIISNDTPATLKAIPGASAGMVLSTGLNVTVLLTPQSIGVDTEEEWVVCNSEFGNSLDVHKFFATSFDNILDGQATTVEHFASGKYLPLLYRSYIQSIAKECSPFLQGVARKLTEEPEWLRLIRNRDLKDLANDTSQNIEDAPLKEFLIEPEIRQALKVIYLLLLERSAAIGATLGAIAVSNLIEDYPKALLGLDSRLAREMPFFFEVYQSTLHDILPLAEARLLQPKLTSEQHEISVPIIGLANALDAL